MIELDEYGAWAQDLGSMNGTHVNGAKIGQRVKPLHEDGTMVQPPRHLLQDGDELRICNNVFAVCLSEEEQPEQKKKEKVSSSGDWHIAICI